MEMELSSFVAVEHVKFGERREISEITMEVGGSDQCPRLTPARGGQLPGPLRAAALGRLSAWNRLSLLFFLRGALGHSLRGRGDRETPLQFLFLRGRHLRASLEGVRMSGGRGTGRPGRLRGRAGTDMVWEWVFLSHSAFLGKHFSSARGRPGGYWRSLLFKCGDWLLGPEFKDTRGQGHVKRLWIC